MSLLQHTCKTTEALGTNSKQKVGHRLRWSLGAPPSWRPRTAARPPCWCPPRLAAAQSPAARRTADPAQQPDLNEHWVSASLSQCATTCSLPHSRPCAATQLRSNTCMPGACLQCALPMSLLEESVIASVIQHMHACCSHLGLPRQANVRGCCMLACGTGAPASRSGARARRARRRPWPSWLSASAASAG